MLLLIRLENLKVDIYNENGEKIGFLTFVSRYNSISAIVTAMMYSPDGEPIMIGSETNEHWHTLHNMVGSFFDKQFIANKIPEIHNIVDSAINDMQSNDGKINLESLKECTLHLILSTVMGVSPNDFKAYEHIPETIAQLQKKSQVLHMFKPMQSMPVINNGYLTLRKVLFETMDKFCREQSHTEFVGEVTKTDNEGNPLIDKSQQYGLLAEIFAAGHETTAAALAWLFDCIANLEDEDLKNELLAEIKANENNLEYFSEGGTLLEAFILESFRLQPITPSMPSRSAYTFNVTRKSTGETLTIKKGQEISLNIGAMTHSEFWTDDEVIKKYLAPGETLTDENRDRLKKEFSGSNFNPRRFFDISKGERTFIHFSEFFPFLTGLRTCLGKELAMAILRSMAVKVLSKGDLTKDVRAKKDASTGVSNPGKKWQVRLNPRAR